MDAARSIQAKKRRQTVLGKQIEAIGVPHSAEREQQLHSVLADLAGNNPNAHTLSAKDVIAGSPEWWKILMACKEGWSAPCTVGLSGFR
jgi:hypothetical protein